MSSGTEQVVIRNRRWTRQAATHHVVQMTGHVGERELRVAIDADLRRIAILAHADGSRIIDRIVRHLPRGALGADDACADESASVRFASASCLRPAVGTMSEKNV